MELSELKVSMNIQIVTCEGGEPLLLCLEKEELEKIRNLGIGNLIPLKEIEEWE